MQNCLQIHYINVFLVYHWPCFFVVVIVLVGKQQEVIYNAINFATGLIFELTFVLHSASVSWALICLLLCSTNIVWKTCLIGVTESDNPSRMAPLPGTTKNLTCYLLIIRFVPIWVMLVWLYILTLNVCSRFYLFVLCSM